MRRLQITLALVGGCALVYGLALDIAAGDRDHAGWLLVGPLPFYAAGLLAFRRTPYSREMTWLLASGSLFAVEVVIGDILLPTVNDPMRTVLTLGRQWAGLGSVVAGFGMIAFYPTGRPETVAERRLLGVAVIQAVVVPAVAALSLPLQLPGLYPGPQPAYVSPVFQSALAPIGPLIELLYYSTIGWILVALVLLARRYRRAPAPERRQIRWLLAGAGAAFLVAWLPLLFVASATDPDSPAQRATTAVLWPIAVTLTLGAQVLPLVHRGAFGVDAPARRSAAYRTLWLLIGVGCVTFAAGVGLVVGRIAPLAVAVGAGIGAVLALQPVRRRLEALADQWVFGSRLDGYRMLTRFGAALERSPRSADLLHELADAVRRGLDTSWAAVVLNSEAASTVSGLHPRGDAGLAVEKRGPPAIAVPIVHAGATLGRIECGPRREDAFLDEDRRLLVYFAARVAAAVHNVILSAELSAQVEVVRQQAAELSASRQRVVQAQDAERRRIQRDLHDGVQQEVVALGAALGLARQRLGRGEVDSATEILDDLDRSIGTLLHDVREFAYSIHPSVLSDQGLLEAVEAQAARLPIAMIVRAEPSLRRVRFPVHIETTAWYGVAEALSNVVKHSGATQVVVWLRQPDHRLLVAIEDDGHGFPPTQPRGLGLGGLADRLDIVGGNLRVDSAPGRGTTVTLEIPLGRDEIPDG